MEKVGNRLEKRIKERKKNEKSGKKENIWKRRKKRGK